MDFNLGNQYKTTLVIIDWTTAVKSSVCCATIFNLSSKAHQSDGLKHELSIDIMLIIAEHPGLFITSGFRGVNN